MMRSFKEIIELWPSPSADRLAHDVGANLETARKWRQRDRIPPEWWEPIVRAAKRRGLPVTMDEMAALAARRHRPVRREASHARA